MENIKNKVEDLLESMTDTERMAFHEFRLKALYLDIKGWSEGEILDGLWRALKDHMLYPLSKKELKKLIDKWEKEAQA